MGLSALAVAKAKGRERPYKLADADGLYLFVNPDGRRYWRMNYRFEGKQRTLSFGVFPDVGLADASEKRDAARRIIASGQDPAAVKKRDALQARMEAGSTFKAVAEEWLDKAKREGRAEVTLGKLKWLLDFAYPKLGSRKISEITAPELLAVLRVIENRGHYETARRLRSTCGQVFRYAIATGLSERDPSADLRGALITPKVTHRAAILEPVAAGALLRSIEAYSGYAVTRNALRHAAHTFARPGEVRQAEWSEFDVVKELWVIPAAKTKMRKAHRVPLSRQALGILEELRPISGHRRHLFPAQGGRDRPMCENRLNLALRRMGFDGGTMTAHGFRAMASTLLNEQGKWNPDAIERQLGHAESDDVRRAYARGEHWAERVEMMQDWSDYLDQLRAGAKILKGQFGRR